MGGDVEYLDVPLEAQLEEGLAQLQVPRVVVRQLVGLKWAWICTEIGEKAGLFAKLQPGRARKRFNAT